ncbi:unnamed protein product, partial [Ixodes pacificus]
KQGGHLALAPLGERLVVEGEHNVSPAQLPVPSTHGAGLHVRHRPDAVFPPQLQACHPRELRKQAHHRPRRGLPQLLGGLSGVQNLKPQANLSNQIAQKI